MAHVLEPYLSRLSGRAKWPDIAGFYAALMTTTISLRLIHCPTFDELLIRIHSILALFLPWLPGKASAISKLMNRCYLFLRCS
jgi:hypothetical protein